MILKRPDETFLRITRYFPTSLGVSARAERAVHSKRTSERCERTSERVSKLRITNIPIFRVWDHCAIFWSSAYFDTSLPLHRKRKAVRVHTRGQLCKTSRFFSSLMLKSSDTYATTRAAREMVSMKLRRISYGTLRWWKCFRMVCLVSGHCTRSLWLIEHGAWNHLFLFWYFYVWLDSEKNR